MLHHADDSTVRVFFGEHGKARLLEHYRGCAGVPPALTELEDEIDRILGTRRWVGRVDKSPFDPGAAEGPLEIPGVAREPAERHE